MDKQNTEKKQWLNSTEIASFVVKYFDSAEILNLFSDADSKWADGMLKVARTAKTQLGIAESDLPLFIRLLEQYQYSKKHPEDPASAGFLDAILFFNQFHYFARNGHDKPNVFAQSFMNQIDRVITDDAVKCAMFLRMTGIVLRRCSEPVRKQMVGMLSKYNEQVGLRNWMSMLEVIFQRHVDDMDLVWNMVEQIEIAATHQIQAEMGKPFQNLAALEGISQTFDRVNSIIYDGMRLHPDYNNIKKRMDEIRKKYQIQNILAMNSEQIAEIPRSGYAQAAALEQELQSLRQKIGAQQQRIAQLESQVTEKSNALDRAEHELAETKKTLADAQARNQTLNTENSALRQENSELGRSKTNSETKLHQLIEAARKMKSGIGSRGVRDYQQMVEEVNSGLGH